MPTLRPASFLSLLLLLTASAIAQDAPPIVKKGQFFELHCHGGDEALADRALAAIEPTWDAVARCVGRLDVKPQKPREVHLYRTIAGYQAADLRLTSGKFGRNLAMTHYDTESSHVALQPPCSDEALRAIGLPALTVELLVWEATHLARRELLGTHGEHPMWLVDGLAGTTARMLAKKSIAPDATSWPTADTAIVRVKQLSKDKKLPPVEAILADRIDELDVQDRYALRCVFFDFVRGESHARELSAVLGIVRSTGGGKGYAGRVLSAAKASFGKKLQGEFGKHVAGLGATWFEVYRSLMPCEGGWQQIAFPEVNAIAWNQAPVEGGTLKLSGKLRILPGDSRQMNLLFGRTADGDFCSVAFVADGGFTVFSFRAKANEWKEVGKANAPSLRLGYTSAFAIEAKGNALHVQCDEQHWDFELPHELPKAVQWGLGAQAGGQGAATGSAGLWTDVVVTGK